MNAIIKTITIVAMLIATPLALAQQFYASVNIGRSEIDLGISGIDDDDTMFSFAGGFKFNDNLAIEAGYMDFGSVKISGNGSVTIDADAVQLSVLGMLPLSQQAGLTGRIGLDMWDASLRYNNVPGFGSGKDSDDGSDLFFGIGAYVNLNDQISLRAEYQLHELDDIDVDTLSLGISILF